LGYVGGGLLLALNLAWILSPATFGLPEEGTLPTRLAFVSVSVWWLVFAIPLFVRVPEPEIRIGATPGTGTAFPVILEEQEAYAGGLDRPAGAARAESQASGPLAGARGSDSLAGASGSRAALGSVTRLAFVQLGQTFRDLRGYRNAFLMLLAFL